MDIALTGKNAFVGGASKGIGKAIAYQLATLGANVTAVARSEDLLKQLIDRLPVSDEQVHDYLLLDYDDLSAFKANVKGLKTHYHIVINNSGGPAGGPMIDADISEFAQAFQRHILTAQILMQAVLPGMKEARYGRFINIISTSVKEPITGLGVSNTIRGAMGNWSKTLANEVGKYGITVNNILPGYTATERLESIIANRASAGTATEEQIASGMKAGVPMGRFAEASEIAAAVGFLASPAAAYINGINVPVDGGRTKSL